MSHGCALRTVSRDRMCVCMLSHVQLFVTSWTVARQAPLSMGSSRQEYWSGLLLPPAGDLPDPGIKPASLVSPALAGGFFTTEPRGKQDQKPLSTSLLGKGGRGACPKPSRDPHRDI